MKKKIFVVAALIYSSLLHAQQDTTGQSLSEVIVTANKFPQKQANTGKVVTIIGKEILEKSSGKTVAELLNQQAGITIIGTQNNMGTNPDVYMRGAALGNTLILIDGIPAYDPSIISNAFDLNHFNIDNIERIEIVKGAQSTLYGSDAVAGVINIITKKGGNKPASLYASSSGGSYNTYKGVAGVNGTTGKSKYNLQYSHLQSAGFSSAYDSSHSNNFDKDAFNQNILSGNFTTALSPKLQASINGQVGGYKTDLDAAAFTDDKDYTVTSKNYQAGAGLVYKYSGGALHFNYNINVSKRNYLDDSASVGSFARYTKSSYTGRSHFTELYTNISLSNHIELLAGGDYRFQNSDQNSFSISSYGPYETHLGKDSTHMHQYSAYASFFLKELGGFHFEAGGRYNHHSKYGSNFTYTINPSYLIGKEVKIFANIASGFKAPSLYQLFDASAGMPLLKPEKSTTEEGGIEYNKDKKLFARLVYFNRNIKDGIDYSYINYKYFNNNNQKDHGLEAEAKWYIGKLTLDANYTYVTGKVTTLNYKYDAATYSFTTNGDTAYNNLFRRPKHTANITVGFQPLDKWYISAHAHFAGKRYEPVYMGAPVLLDAYQTIDAYTEYKFGKNLKAFADLKNITGTNYFDILGYTTARFNFMAGITLNL